MNPESRLLGQQFVTFLNKAVTPYHAVEECCNLLRAAGFQELKEADSWKIEPTKKYFLTRNRSALFAFAVGGQFRPGNGFSMIAAHTDSPNLRVKPVSKLSSAGCVQVGVSTYGGGLWRTWFDRDLTVAGRLIIKEGEFLKPMLINVKRPIMVIPSLAIHLDTDRDKFAPNKEEHLKPIFATQVRDALNNKKDDQEKSEDKKEGPNHDPTFLKLIADEAGVAAEDIVDFDLSVIDTQPATIGGVHEEFVFGGRLDNLVGSFTTISGLIQSTDDQSTLINDPNIRMGLLFDNEECGSSSAQGAESSLTEWILRRLSTNGSSTAFEESIAKSYLISADQAHAVHPNYQSKHESNHAVKFHAGVVVKMNYNQRYASTALTNAILQQVADKADVPLQKFVVRNDSPCGSTIGPLLSSKLGLQTIDVGTAQLAMHSIREMCDITGIWHALKLYTKFYRILPEILAKVEY